MSEACHIKAEIAELKQRQLDLAKRAHLLAERCAILRADNPADPRIADLAIQVDACDAEYDRLDDLIYWNEMVLDDIEAEERNRPCNWPHVGGCAS